MSKYPWVAVLTKPRCEIPVDDRLRAIGCDTVCLRYWGAVKHARRVVRAQKPYFPRYVLAKGDIWDIRRTPGVSDLVRNGDGLVPVPISVVEELKSRGDEWQVVGLSEPEIVQRERFLKGQKVKIKDGPFIGFLATIEVDKGKAVRAYLENFQGGRVLTTFGAESLEAVSP